MKKWQEEQLQALLSAQSEQDVFNTITRAITQLGFEQCSVGMRLPIPISQPKDILYCNYSTDWLERYMSNNYALVDPTVAHAARSIRPLVWDEPLFSESREFWEDARAHGLNVGWTQSCHSAQGIGSMLTLARSHENLSESELDAHGLHIIWLGQLAHEGLSKFLIPALLPEANVTFTARELEVLRWTAEGKTSAEVGAIMNISHSTVNFHINNVVAKLGVANKTAAAIKAVALRLI